MTIWNKHSLTSKIHKWGDTLMEEDFCLKGHVDITTAYHDYVPFAYANQVRLSIRLIP